MEREGGDREKEKGKVKVKERVDIVTVQYVCDCEFVCEHVCVCVRE